MNDNNIKEIKFNGQDVPTPQTSSVCVVDVLSELGDSLDDVAEQLNVKFNRCFREINVLKAKVLCLSIICFLLTLAMALQGIGIWK